MQINGDLIPITSGVSDIGDLYIPFIEVHQESGLFYHNSTNGNHGVMRYDGDIKRLQGSNDGGTTFFNIPIATGGGVDSLGVIGQTDLIGDIDLTSSGFVNLHSTGQNIFIDVNTTALSGFWGLQNMDDVVNSIKKTGSAALVDDVTLSEGEFVDLTQAAQDITFDVDTASLSGHYGLKNMDVMVQGYHETIGAASTTWTVNHNLNTAKVIVYIWDDTGNPLNIIADDIQRTSVNQVVVTFNSAQDGEVVVMGF